MLLSDVAIIIEQIYRLTSSHYVLIKVKLIWVVQKCMQLTFGWASSHLILITRPFVQEIENWQK